MPTWRKPTVAAIAALALLGGALTVPASAADRAVTNYGFETTGSGVPGWTTIGGETSVSAEQHYDGKSSAKVVDSDTGPAGLESTRITNVTAGQKFDLYASVFRVSGTPALYLRFYQEDGTIVSFHQNYAGTADKWSRFKLTGTAPADVVGMTALLYSGTTDTGTAYWDEVLFTAHGETPLGAQVDNSMPTGCTFGIGTGQHLAYGAVSAPTTADGYSAKLAEVDMNTNTVSRTVTLPKALGASSATTTSDGSIYVGTNNEARLYRYEPALNKVTNIANGSILPGQTFIWSLTTDEERRVYGGTANGVRFFTYRPGEAVGDLGSLKSQDKQTSVRAITFDPRGDQAVFLGTGYTKGELIRYDRKSQDKVNILPAEYVNTATSVTGLTFTGNRLFAKVAGKIKDANGDEHPYIKMLVLDVTKLANGSIRTIKEEEFEASSLEVSPVLDGKVYYPLRGALRAYDIATRDVITDLNVTVPITTCQLGWAELTGSNYPGKTLVALGSTPGMGLGKIFKYNPQSKHVETATISGMPLQPTRINSLTTGPDGRIYSGGFFSGGLGAYDPLHGDRNDRTPEPGVFRGIGQVDGMTTDGEVMYLASYPGAVFYSYVPGGALTPLPKLQPSGQDRPYALLAADGKLFTGTVPNSSNTSGTFGIYDVAGKAATIHDLQTAFGKSLKDQSVVSLAYQNGIVYGGTSMRLPSGAPTADAAYLFSYDVATKAIKLFKLPAAMTSLTALRAVDGKIWGCGNGYTFQFDPASNTFSKPPKQQYDEAFFTAPQWRDAVLITVPTDTANLYGTAGDHLFRLNKATNTVTTLTTKAGMEYLTADAYGNLYYSQYHNLFRYVP